MKSKAPLVMMEQIIMVLIFALASVLCLQTFVLAGKISKRTEVVNCAAMEAQNVAEIMKSQGLDEFIETLNGEQILKGVRVFFDKEWNRMTEAEQAVYYLDIYPENSDSVVLWKAEISVAEKDGTILFRIPVAGQTEVIK